MELKEHWKEIRHVLHESKKSNHFFSIATVDKDGNPHVTPIGHVFFRDDMTAYYFDEYSEAMPKNFEANKKVCLMGVNSSNWFWLKSLFKAEFKSAPAVRLFGEVEARREATCDEINTLKKAIKATRKLKGNQLLWGNLTKVRDIRFTAFSPAKYPVMCEKHWKTNWKTMEK